MGEEKLLIMEEQPAFIKEEDKKEYIGMFVKHQFYKLVGQGQISFWTDQNNSTDWIEAKVRMINSQSDNLNFQL